MEFFDLNFVSQFGEVKSIIHIGAHHAQERIEYAEFGVPSVIWIEAHPDFAEVMKENLIPYQNQYGFDACLSSCDGEDVDFWITADEWASSLLVPYLHQTFHPEALVTGKIKLKTITFQTFWKELEDENHPSLNSFEYNYLTIDTQGSELEIMRGMGDMLAYFDFVCTEYSTIEWYHNGPQLEDLTEILESFNFEMVYPKVPIAHGDALFVKKRISRRGYK